MPFSKLGLSSPIVKAVSALGYDKPTSIQEKAIPINSTSKAFNPVVSVSKQTEVCCINFCNNNFLETGVFINW